jgi:hypothetical protein
MRNVPTILNAGVAANEIIVQSIKVKREDKTELE